ncbi:MAG: hypothetical protein ACXVRV_15865, partial [Gaiellaceae bacterium]
MPAFLLLCFALLAAGSGASTSAGVHPTTEVLPRSTVDWPGASPGYNVSFRGRTSERRGRFRAPQRLIVFSGSSGQEGVKRRTGFRRGVDRRRRGETGVSRTSGYLFVGGYAAALFLLGIVPAAYAVQLAFTTYSGALTTGNFGDALNNPFVVPAFEHIGELLG